MTEVDSVIPEGNTAADNAVIAAAVAAVRVVAATAAIAVKKDTMPTADSEPLPKPKAVASTVPLTAAVDSKEKSDDTVKIVAGDIAPVVADAAIAATTVVVEEDDEEDEEEEEEAEEEDSQATTTSTDNGAAGVGDVIDDNGRDESAAVETIETSKPKDALDASHKIVEERKPIAVIAAAIAVPLPSQAANHKKHTNSADTDLSAHSDDDSNSSSSSVSSKHSHNRQVVIETAKPAEKLPDVVPVAMATAKEPSPIKVVEVRKLISTGNAVATDKSKAATVEIVEPKATELKTAEQVTPEKVTIENITTEKATNELKKPNGTAPAAIEPKDTAENVEPVSLVPLKLTVEKQKENGIVAAIPLSKMETNIVNLDDDSDDEDEEMEEDDIAAVPNVLKLALNPASNGCPTDPLNVMPSKLNDSMSSGKNRSACSDSDGAVVIGSDSETESFFTQARPLPPLMPTRDVKAPALATQLIDDDDDDCVVIEDDTPAPPPPMPSDLSKRKSGVLESPGNSDDSQPPSKRQRNGGGGGTPQNSISQITIKDARSLMPHDIGTKRAADGNIYPVTIMPTVGLPQQQQQQLQQAPGPPKLVPMSNAIGGMGMPGLPGMQCNANLLPGLTDDMFVLEAPSFIVPYIYEKPPVDQLKDIIRDLQSKYELSKEDLAEASNSDEFDMMTEQNKDEKPGEGDKTPTNNKRKRRQRGGDDESWSEESDEDEDDDDDSESGVRTKVLIKEASDDLTALKSVIKPASVVTQSMPGVPAKPGQENYFESPLGKFFMDIGVGLVQEFVQSDLIRLQKRKMRKSLGKNINEFERAITALSGNLEASKKKNSPFKFTMKRCEFCNFKSESALAMANHYETPHMHGPQYKCNFCTFEIRNATEIVYHMEAMHNIKARLIKPLPYHQCPNCGFEDNGKAKLARHQPVCAKKYRPELNLAPPIDWEAPAKIPRIKPRHGLVGTATAYQAMAAQAAAQKAALASIQQQQQQAAQARNLQAAALAAQNAANKIRGRPPILHPPKTVTNVGGGGVSMLRATNQVRTPMATNVVMPNNYQLAGGQIIQHPQQVANAMAKKNLSGQPSISITPLPRQSAAAPVAAPSTSKLPPAGMKPGQNPLASGGKTQFVICEICDGYIKDLEQLRNHMQWMHKVKIHPKMIYNRPPLNCQKCQFRFFTDQGLERHLLGSHGLVTSSMQEAANKGKDAGRCPVCGRMYQWKLLNHVSRDHHMTLKPAHLSYKCTVCTATFGMYKQFETHVYTAHSTVAKKAMDGKKSNSNAAPSSGAPTGSGNSNRSGLSVSNDSLLKPLKINDEITIIPQPASKPRITNMESHIID